MLARLDQEISSWYEKSWLVATLKRNYATLATLNLDHNEEVMQIRSAFLDGLREAVSKICRKELDTSLAFAVDPRWQITTFRWLGGSQDEFHPILEIRISEWRGETPVQIATGSIRF